MHINFTKGNCKENDEWKGNEWQTLLLLWMIMYFLILLQWQCMYVLYAKGAENQSKNTNSTLKNIISINFIQL
jgi:hypothetical protein